MSSSLDTRNKGILHVCVCVGVGRVGRVVQNTEVPDELLRSERWLILALTFITGFLLVHKGDFRVDVGFSIYLITTNLSKTKGDAFWSLQSISQSCFDNC